ncbi:hypothetical protein K050079A111_11300 [Bilophila wadsworthia]
MEAEGTDGRRMGTAENARRGEWGTDTDGDASLCRFPGWFKVSWGASGISGGHPLRLPFFP